MTRPAHYHPQIETLSRDELQSLQLERLKWQVTRCDEGSPFYLEKFRSAGVEPGDIKRLENVASLPFVTKEELREEQAAQPPFGRYVVAPMASIQELHPSTGTTGHPVHTLWSFRDCETIADFTARMLFDFGTRPGDIIQNAFSYGLWIAGLAVHYAGRLLRCFVIPIGATQTERQIWYFQNAGSTVFLSTPSFALHIAERLREAGISPDSFPLRIGSFGGEGGTEARGTREKIEQGLGIEAYDIYGLSEIHPTMAAECSAKTGLHWTEDHHLIEVVDPLTRKPLPEGKQGILVMTHLTREAAPMIRYWTNDYAILDPSPCPCGGTHVRSPGGILGRADDLIVYRGAKFYPIQVEKVVRGTAGLGNEFQIVMTRDEKTGADVCTVLAESLPGETNLEALRARLLAALKAELQVTPNLDLKPFGTLERTTHKARRYLDRRKKES